MVFMICTDFDSSKIQILNYLNDRKNQCTIDFLHAPRENQSGQYILISQVLRFAKADEHQYISGGIGSLSCLYSIIPQDDHDGRGLGNGSNCLFPFRIFARKGKKT